MAHAKLSWTREEWNRMLGGLRPPTDDDVSVTKDGRRLDTLEKVLEFAAEVDAERERLSHAAPRRAR